MYTQYNRLCAHCTHSLVHVYVVVCDVHVLTNKYLMHWYCSPYTVHFISVCAVLVGSEDQLPHDPVPAERQPRVQTSHRVLHIQAGM